MIYLLGTLYGLAAIGLAIYGLFGLLTLALFLRHRSESQPIAPPLLKDKAPMVTIQLPVYNEPLVIERLIDAAVAMDYPKDRLQVLVLDDSTDSTTKLAASRVGYYRSKGFDIELIHRANRKGYKAGALQEGLERTKGAFTAIFDADFIPDRDFVKSTVPHFLNEKQLGMVQTRWGHLNSDYTLLTRAQAISLDKHFAIEQLVRHRANLFPKFNGSGGIWRTSCISESGGWLADTVCEDLDLSTRAQLDGWRFLFLPEVTSPAELPPQMTAFKIQQARWAKGSLQCVQKFWKQILSSRRHSMVARLYALISMTGYLAHPLLITLLLLLPPLLSWGYDFSPIFAWLSVAGIAQPILFTLSQQAIYPDWGRRMLAGAPALALVAVGLAPSNTWSIIEMITQQEHVFYRTPKFDLLPTQEGGWTPRRNGVPLPIRSKTLILFESTLTLYAGAGAVTALLMDSYGSLPFLFLCMAGFGYTAFQSVADLAIDRTHHTARLPQNS